MLFSTAFGDSQILRLQAKFAWQLDCFARPSAPTSLAIVLLIVYSKLAWSDLQPKRRRSDIISGNSTTRTRKKLMVYNVRQELLTRSHECTPEHPCENATIFAHQLWWFKRAVFVSMADRPIEEIFCSNASTMRPQTRIKEVCATVQVSRTQASLSISKHLLRDMRDTE